MDRAADDIPFGWEKALDSRYGGLVVVHNDKRINDLQIPGSSDSQLVFRELAGNAPRWTTYAELRTTLEHLRFPTKCSKFNEDRHPPARMQEALTDLRRALGYAEGEIEDAERPQSPKPSAG